MRPEREEDPAQTATAVQLIEQKERMRYQVLAAVYLLTSGEELHPITIEGLARTTKHSTSELKGAIRYLWGEGLLAEHGTGYTSVLTHAGIVEYESSVTNPDRPTSHFGAATIQIFNGPVGAVQTGEKNAADVRQREPKPPKDQ